jgi:pimeloyl-ACP methyl ester carboxylesterase
MLSGFIKIPRFSVALHYITNNFNKARDMVIHHGLMGSCKNFKSISKNQKIADYTNSYLIDCRNHGQSPHTASNKISDLADDLHEFVLHHKLHKNKKLTLMGHSMGAMALMAFTEKYPQMQEFVDRVILIDINCAPRKEDKGVANTGAMLRSMLEIDLSQDTKTVFRAIEERAINKDTAGLIKTNIEVLGEKQHRWIPNLEVILKDFDELINFELHKNDWRKPVEVIYGA